MDERWQLITKALGDRSYDKRKKAALDLEALMRHLYAEGQHEKIKQLVGALARDFTRSSNPNFRKGGLIGLASTSLALAGDAHLYLEQLLPPVLSCFEDSDSRVRYYACESLFNVAKVARGNILRYFDRIFDGLCKLFADVDVDVKNGAQLLDRLIKEIVTESDSFDMDKFMPLLQKYITRSNPYVRQLLVGWITVLDSVPELDMLDYLPRFLDGLFAMLSDGNREIRQQADQALVEFLREIKQAKFQDLNVEAIVHTLVTQCTVRDRFSRLTAVTWVREFIMLGRHLLVELYPALLDAVLHCIADDEKEIRAVAAAANAELIATVRDTEEGINYRLLVTRLTRTVTAGSVPTRIASLRWLSMLLERAPEPMLGFLDDLFPALCRTLSADADEVVLLDLEVLARIALNEDQFPRVLQQMLALFAADRRLLERRGSLAIRNLCVHLDAGRVFHTMAGVLAEQEDLEFASLMVQTLSLILLTASELEELRATLKRSFSPTGTDEDKAVFKRLFESWCHNPVSTFSLCLLSQAYQLAAELVQKFADLDVSLGFLLQVDKLVHLLESPIFIHLRLQLLQREHPEHADLLRALYGLLMLLPQSAAFTTLRNRLQSVSSLHTALASSQGITSDATEAPRRDFGEYLKAFEEVQARHTAARRDALQRRGIRSGAAAQ